MSETRVAAVVLAAGKGTRMKSDLPKVLHPVAGRPMIRHVLAMLDDVAPDRTVVVVAPGMDSVVSAVAPARVAVQQDQQGTAHAVLAARSAFEGFSGDVVIVNGDTPLLTAETVETMLRARRGRQPPAVVALGFRPRDPAEYGRLRIGEDGGLDAIVEYRDASPEEKAGTLCNAGVMVVDGGVLFGLLDTVGTRNAKGEYYLTDIVAIARSRGLRCAVVETPDATEAMGVDSRAGLARAEEVMQDRLRRRAMEAGVTLTAPETVWLAADTEIGRDVTIGPNVVIGPGTRISDGAAIRAFSHIEGADLGPGTVVGPFARLRPGTRLRRGARVGNFVEVKAAVLGENVRVGHLSYVGDAEIGDGANIGAGTITCNYDGISKHFTRIGAGAFIGSNSALVAPVTVGDDAIVGAGSVVTSEVGRGAISIARGRQRNLDGQADAFRRRRKAESDTGDG